MVWKNSTAIPKTIAINDSIRNIHIKCTLCKKKTFIKNINLTNI